MLAMVSAGWPWSVEVAQEVKRNAADEWALLVEDVADSRDRPTKSRKVQAAIRKNNSYFLCDEIVVEQKGEGACLKHTFDLEDGRGSLNFALSPVAETVIRLST